MVYDSQTDVVLIMSLFEYLKQFSDWRFFRVGTTAVEVLPMTITPSAQRVVHIRERVRVPELMLLTHAGTRQLCEDNDKVRLDHNSPLLVIDIVRRNNADEIYLERRAQYEARGIYEYWILDRYIEAVTVLSLTDSGYQGSCYKGNDWVISEVFPKLALTALGMLPVEGFL